MGLTPASFLPWGALYKSFRRCDLVLDIGAGDSFADIYGAKRFTYQALSKLYCLLARRPLILAPQTLGPYSHWWSRMAVRWILPRCRALVARDALSLQALTGFSLPEQSFQATDIAFALPYVPPPPRTGGPVKVGINVSALLYNGGYTRQNMFGLVTNYVELAERLFAAFADTKGCEVHAIAHVISKRRIVEDDYRLAESLAERFPGTVLAPRFADPSEAKSYIAGMDFFCGSRMHACIAAFSAGVPVVPIAYSRKFAGLFEALDYRHTADCRTQSAEEILQQVVSGFEQREPLRREIARGNEIATRRLQRYRDLIRSCLQELQARRQP